MKLDINIFEFSDYRVFLKTWIVNARLAKTGNLSKLAGVARVHPTFLTQVFSGTKDLSLEQATFISISLEQTKLEQEYFFALIQLERAGTQELKEYWQNKKQEISTEKLKISQRFKKHHQLTQEQKVTFYSSWIYVAVWGATSINDGQTLSQIAERFRISRGRAEEILNFLVQCGICNKIVELYKVGQVHVHIPNESPLVVKHHTNWRLKSMQKMDYRDPQEVFFTSPISMALNDIEVIREKIMGLIKDIVTVATHSEAEELVCLNIDFFRTIP